MRSLRTTLLVNLGILTGGALLLVGFSAVLAAAVGGTDAVWVVIVYGAGAMAVFVGFGAWLLDRMVLRPMRQLAQTADTLADGAGFAPDTPFESAEFRQLDERFR